MTTRPNRLEAIEWAGTLSGIAGGLLLALKVETSGFGFLFFFVSSVGWLIAGVHYGNIRLALQQAVFTAINLVGIYRWLLA